MIRDAKQTDCTQNIHEDRSIAIPDHNSTHVLAREDSAHAKSWTLHDSQTQGEEGQFQDQDPEGQLSVLYKFGRQRNDNHKGWDDKILSRDSEMHGIGLSIYYVPNGGSQLEKVWNEAKDGENQTIPSSLHPKRLNPKNLHFRRNSPGM